jgi:uridylate kinase
MTKPIIVSLGGSLIVPGDVDISFLKEFRKLILDHVESGKRFVIICGGGSTTRMYQKAAKEVVKLESEDLDWIGIHATRLNAHLMRTVFRDIAHPRIIKDPTRPIVCDEPIIIAAGWKPGFSTDYDAVLLAKGYNADTVMNLTNIEQVCDKDPKYHKDAKPIEKIGWPGFRKIVGDEWVPGSNLPFDPIASKEAEKLGLRVMILKGTDIPNLDKALKGEKFKGTVVSD